MAVFENIAVASAEEFRNGFLTQLESVYEYSKKDIIEYLVPDTSDESDQAKCRERLSCLRDALLAKLIETLPCYSNKDMYNRRKLAGLAEDVYLMGYAIVNKQADTRLNKALKSRGNSSQTSESDDGPVSSQVDENHPMDLVLACASLKDTVAKLTTTVKQLQKQYLDLQRRLPTNVIRQESDADDIDTDNTPLLPLDETSDSDDSSDTSSVSGEPDPDDNIAASNPGSNGIVPPTSGQSGNGDTGDSQTDSTGFRLSGRERKRLRKGNIKTQNANKKPITGSAMGALRIKAASQNASPTRAVYVGNLDRGTTTDDIRAHLGDVAARGISDVLLLSNDGARAASFCVTVDNQEAENALFQPSVWPEGTRVRAYVSRPRGRRGSNSHTSGSTQNNRATHSLRNTHGDTRRNRRVYGSYGQRDRRVRHGRSSRYGNRYDTHSSRPYYRNDEQQESRYDREHWY